jgi:hypothetical protein
VKVESGMYWYCIAVGDDERLGDSLGLPLGFPEGEELGSTDGAVLGDEE